MTPHDTPLPPGTRIGGDVVEAVLGSGGFATVYRVRSPEGYVSALKLLPLEGPERAARAWREMSLGTRLRHPNLARQLGAGQWPLDKPRFLWLKLELIEGSTLDEWGLAPGAPWARWWTGCWRWRAPWRWCTRRGWCTAT
jgi:serine/threonine-protein kinase